MYGVSMKNEVIGGIDGLPLVLDRKGPPSLQLLLNKKSNKDHSTNMIGMHIIKVILRLITLH